MVASRRAASTLVAVCLSVGLSACGPGDEPASAIVGDWFTCLDLQCSQLGGVGNRFTASGDFIALYPKGQLLGPQDRYCATSNAELIYRYTWDEQALRIEDNDGALLTRYTFVVEGEQARVINQDSGNMLDMRRLASPRESGPCSQRVPWICPKFDKREPAAGSCSLTWVCDRGTYEVSCEASGSCACAAGGAAGKSFPQAGTCAMGVAQLGQLYTAVNSGCGWQLSLLPF